MSNEVKASRYPTFFIIACFIIIGFFLFLIFRPFFSILVWASVLAVVFLPLFQRVLRLLRGRRAVAGFITCLLILLLIVLPVTLLGLIIAQQSVSLYHSLQSSDGMAGADTAARWHQFQSTPAAQWILAQMQRWLGADSNDLNGYVKQTLGALSKVVVTNSPTLIAGLGGMVFSFFLIFITMFFLFRDGPDIMEILRTSTPLPEAYESEIIQKFQDVSYATFFGSIFTAFVQGSAAAALFWILGIPSPLFWGAVVAFVALVPIVGAFLVWIPMSGYLYLTGDPTRALLVLAIGGLVVSSIDNVLKPLIIQGRTKMHPLLVFLSVLGGMQLVGFLGILLGPLVVAVFISFLNFYRLEFQDALSKKVPQL